MIDVIHFAPEHLYQIQEQRATDYMRPRVTFEHAQSLAGQPHSYTVLKDGKPIACGGVLEYWMGRGEAWAVLDAVSRKDFMAVHNAARRFIAAINMRRIEAVVQTDFTAGHRWLRALGFQMEAPLLKAYDPDGRDFSLYARVP